MPVFEYKALSEAGEVITGQKQAADAGAVIDYLRRNGHIPVFAHESAGRLRFRLFNAKKQVQLSDKTMSLLFGELATLLNAGLALEAALVRVYKLAKGKQLKSLLERLLKGIQQGETLADTMALEAGVFSRLQISLVRAGEASGSLETVMTELADYQEAMLELKQTAVTSMIYPTILVVMSLLSLVVMMTFVVPQFMPLFEGAEQPLPWLTARVFDLAILFQLYWWVPLIMFISAALLFELLAKTPERKQKMDAFWLKIPVIGSLSQAINVARFARTLGSLIRHDVSLLQAVSLAEGALSNQAMQIAVNNSKAELEQGKRLSGSLHNKQLFPELLLELIEVGEESGQLANMLEKAAKVYDQEVTTRSRRLLTILEPVMIVGMGAVIGLIVIAIMLAMLGLNDLVV